MEVDWDQHQPGFLCPGVCVMDRAVEVLPAGLQLQFIPAYGKLEWENSRDTAPVCDFRCGLCMGVIAFLPSQLSRGTRGLLWLCR